MRKGVRLVGIVTFNIVLTLLLLEGALHLVPLPAGFRSYLKAIGMMEQQKASMVKDPLTGIPALRPRQTITWSIMDGDWTITTVPFPDNKDLGLRDDGLNPEAKRKVFACGDSYTFGFGVDNEQVWHEVLERMYQGSVDIFNLREAGNSIADIRDVYPLYKDRFAHDTVFLCIYLGNEFFDNYLNRERHRTPEAGEERPRQTTFDQPGQGGSALLRYVWGHSYAARMVKFRFFRQWAKLGYYRLDSRREIYQPEGSPFVFTIDYEENILVRTCEKTYSPEMEAGVTAFRDALGELVYLIRQDGRQIYAFVFPFKEQVYWEQWVSRLAAPALYDRFKPNKIVDEALEAQGIEFYDLTTEMVEAGRQEILYWPIDSHWNPAGNQLAAELVHQWLGARLP